MGRIGKGGLHGDSVLILSQMMGRIGQFEILSQIGRIGRIGRIGGLSQEMVIKHVRVEHIITLEGTCADGSFVFVTQIATCHHSLLQGSTVLYSHCLEVIICSHKRSRER